VHAELLYSKVVKDRFGPTAWAAGFCDKSALQSALKAQFRPISVIVWLVCDPFPTSPFRFHCSLLTANCDESPRMVARI
jgi:hypothetical protein